MGDLARALLTEEIRSLLYSRNSGILVVSNSEVTKGIFFRAGQIVFGSSTLDSDKLGENLVRLGRISRAQFAAAYQATRGGKSRLGQALVGAGLVTEEELGRLVAHQVRKIVLSLFTWTSGETAFQEAPDPIPPDLALDLSTHHILLEGARIYPDPRRLEEAIGDHQRRVRVSPRPPFDYRRLSFTPAERQALEDAQSEQRIAAILARPLSRDLLARAVYSLIVGGILEDADAEEDVLARPIEENTSTFRAAIAAVTGRADPSEADRRERILRLYEAMSRATHYEILELPPDAEPEAITGAFARINDEMERYWRDFKGDLQLSSILSTLRLRQREAHRVLSDPHGREQYDRWLGSLHPEEPRKVSPEAHHRAHRLTREAVALLDRGERDRAVPLLLEAVDTDPEDVDSRRFLALTLAQHATLFRTAERHFLVALELEPHDVELRYRLAAYYRKAGLPKRAIVQIRRVLEANPQHDAALVDFEELKREVREARD
jgi:tetratricopeptide (TPR) repeat protein